METYMQQPKLSSICLAVITSALLLTSTAGFAANYKGESNYKGEAMAPAPCPQPLMLRDGLYVGANALYDSYRTRITRTSAIAPVFSNYSSVLASNGWGGGLFGGYGMYFNNMWYLAGEVFIDGSGASQSASFGTTAAVGTYNVNFTQSVGMSWGVSALPGYKLNDSTLGFIRLGYEGARLRAQNNGTTPTLAFSNSKTQWKSAFEYGVGIETAVYPDVSVRGEFDHAGYGQLTSSLARSTSTDNQYNLGVIYHFAL
jgi:opacity protein-like surface antigen